MKNKKKYKRLQFDFSEPAFAKNFMKPLNPYRRIWMTGSITPIMNVHIVAIETWVVDPLRQSNWAKNVVKIL